MTQPPNPEQQAIDWLKAIVEAFGKDMRHQVVCDGIMAFGSIHLSTFARAQDECKVLRAKVADLEKKLADVEKAVVKLEITPEVKSAKKART